MDRLIEAFGINVPSLIAQLVNFIVLFLLLFFFAYKPILKMLDNRSGKIKRSMEQVEEIKEQAAHSEQEAEKRINTATKEGQDIVGKAMRNGEELNQRSQEQARKDAEILINRARAEIQHERDEAIAGLRQEFAALTIKAAEKVIDRSLDERAHREIIDKVLNESTLKE
jgi:F-type H+-transporting ATPase subunit b